MKGPPPVTAGRVAGRDHEQSDRTTSGMVALQATRQRSEKLSEKATDVDLPLKECC